MATELRCYDCSEWVGRCKKDQINRIAMDPACSEYQPKKQRFLIEISLYGQKPVSEIDIAICLKHLPIESSQASFRVTRQELSP
jgi:hypothetical protein